MDTLLNAIEGMTKELTHTRKVNGPDPTDYLLSDTNPCEREDPSEHPLN